MQNRGEDLSFHPISKPFTHATRTEQLPYLPSSIQFIVAHKVGVVPFQSVQDQGLISLRDVNIPESTLVRQVHVHGDRLGIQPRSFCVQFQIHRLRWLNANHELVSRNVFEDSRSDILELDSDLDLGLIQSWE